MSQSIPPQQCPQCGKALPPDAPAGLCPGCVMALNLGEETVLTGELSAAAAPPIPSEEIAPHFPELEIVECLGRGGMGVVYKARQRSLDRLVALKLLAPERKQNIGFAERFAREAQALAALDHPHIVTVYDFGERGGLFYLLMEYVDGVNLRELLRARKLTPDEALAIVPPVCEALQFAHERGIVHCDIKPENLLLDRDGRVKIADFGIARMVGAGGAAAAAEIAGTPGYMAPEQRAEGRGADHRVDIYSLGVVFYEMLTGERPGTALPAPSRKIQVDVRLDAIVLRALETAPERRYDTAADLRTDVETFISDRQTATLSGAEMAAFHDTQSVGGRRAIEFRSRAARVLAGLSALGSLAFLGAVPGLERMWGFAGFFGFIGIAVLVEGYARTPVAIRRWLWRGVLFVVLLLSTIFAFRSCEWNVNEPAQHRSSAGGAMKNLMPGSSGVSSIHAANHGVYMAQSEDRLYYAMYYAGRFDPARSTTRSARIPDGTWTEEGGITLASGRSFGFRREYDSPDVLTINGREYRLPKGRLFILHEDGTITQRATDVQRITRENLPTLVGDNSDAAANSGNKGSHSMEVAASRDRLVEAQARYEVGAGTAEDVAEARYKADLAEANQAGDETGAAKARVDFARQRLDLLSERLDAGAAPVADLREAELELARAVAALEQTAAEEKAR